MSVDQFSADYDASLTEADRATTTSGRIPTAGHRGVHDQPDPAGDPEAGARRSWCRDLPGGPRQRRARHAAAGAAVRQRRGPLRGGHRQPGRLREARHRAREGRGRCGHLRPRRRHPRRSSRRTRTQLETPAQTCLHALFILVDQADTDRHRAHRRREGGGAGRGRRRRGPPGHRGLRHRLGRRLGARDPVPGRRPRLPAHRGAQPRARRHRRSPRAARAERAHRSSRATTGS